MGRPTLAESKDTKAELLQVAMEMIQTRGYNAFSYQDLAESIGISKSSVQAAVSWLRRRELLSIAKENATAVPRYTALTPWKRPARPKSARTR